MELACAPLRVARRWDRVSMAGRGGSTARGQRSRKDAGLRPKDPETAGVGALQPAGSRLAPGRLVDLGRALSDLWISVGRCGCGAPPEHSESPAPGQRL